MGWCNATELVDAVIGALDAAYDAGYVEYAAINGHAVAIRRGGTERERELRSLVRLIATRFRDDDWDCVEESDFYDRFGPELRGETDVEHVVRQYQTFEDEPLRFVEWLDRFRAAGREVPGWSLDEGV